MIERSICMVFLIIVLLLELPPPLQAAPRPELWSRWEPKDAFSAVSVDPAPWVEFLRESLVTDQPSGINRVKDGAVDCTSNVKLDQYFDALQQVAASRLNTREPMAHRINLYNALNIKMVLDHCPATSILDGVRIKTVGFRCQDSGVRTQVSGLARVCWNACPA